MFFQNLVHAQRFKYPIATYPLTLGAGEIDGVTLNADTTESVGSNLVTDSGFDAVTEGAEINTQANASSPTNETDATTGWDDAGSLGTFESVSKGDEPVGTYSIHGVANGSNDACWTTFTTVVGNTYLLDVRYIVTNGDADTGITVRVGTAPASGTVYSSPGLNSTSWAQLSDVYFNATATTTYVSAVESGTGNDPNFYIDTVSLKPVTFTNLTTTHWAPQAVGGVLTGKAVKFAGTADDLEQDISAVASTIYRDQYVATRSAGTLTPQVGGVDGTAITADGTYIDDITASTTGNLKFQADASFAGTVDLSTARAVTNPKQNGITVELHRDSERLVTYKTVAGTTTVLDDSAITYSATEKVIAIHDSANLLSVFYDSALVYSGTVSDASIVNNKRHYVATGEGSGAFSVERLRYGAEIATGTCTISLLYYITATEADHFAAGLVVGDYFISDGTETLDANNKVKQVNP